MRQSLENRLRSVRSRAAVRAWEYRQRNHAKGTWYRLRRLLADAAVAYALTEQAARELLAEGRRSEPIGEQLEPPKTILWVPKERIEALAGKQQIPLRLTADFLAARYIALVAYEAETKPGRESEHEN